MPDKVLHEVRVVETEDGFRIEIKGDKERLRQFVQGFAEGFPFGPFRHGPFGRGPFKGGPFGHGPFRHGPGRHGPRGFGIHFGPWWWGDEEEEDEAKGGADAPRA